MLDHPDVVGLKGILLRTRDAHGLYRRFGFVPLQGSDEMMIRTIEPSGVPEPLRV